MAIIIGGIPSETLIGGLAADLISGLGGNDSLTGNEDSDTLDGGKGADTLVGGVGNDSYVVDNAKDVVTETSGDLDDRVLAPFSVNLGLPAFAGIEHVTLTGLAASGATGNDGANMLIGNAAANKLDGGKGVDTLIGGAGNDVYLVDDLLDLTIENPGEGIDTVISTISAIDLFVLNANIENLTLGKGVFSGSGNTLGNVVTGNATNNAIFGDAGNDTLIGDDGVDSLNGGIGADRLIGGKEGDWYYVDNVGDKVVESSPAGGSDIVLSTIAFNLGANLENLKLEGAENIDGSGNALNNSVAGNDGNNVLRGLTGNDDLGGNAGDDLLLGGDGNDFLRPLAGVDTLVGGAGSDTFNFSDGTFDGVDVVADFSGLPDGDKLYTIALVGDLAAGTEADFIQTEVANGSTVVRLDLDGIGGTFAFKDMAVLQGVSTDLDGLLANGSIINVGTPSTKATVLGAGNDLYSTGFASELVFGLGGNDSLTGGGGSDTLDGGAGKDGMNGLLGSDTFVVDSLGDVIQDSGGFDDRVLASISIDLGKDSLYGGVEHATLAGIGALNATGDEINNMLIGNAAANKLNGNDGTDTLIGGGGNDIYTIDDDPDLIIEYVGGGIDTVVSIASDFNLGDNIENLTLALGAVNGGGNALANKITGNTANNQFLGGDGNDTLIGNAGDDFLLGGAGADSMVGGAGNDRYAVDNIADKVVETGPVGDIDKVFSTVSYTLGASIEDLNLDLLADIDGTGNALANVINGNSGNNVLRGLAGNDQLHGQTGSDLLFGDVGNDTLTAAEGTDTLVGGAGSDLFNIFIVPSAPAEVETIADFNALLDGDKIQLPNPLPDDITGIESEFVQTITANGSTTIQVDIDGTGGPAVFKDATVLQGVSTDLAGLLANGSLFDSTTTKVSIDGTAGADNKAGTGASDLIRGFGGNDTLTGDAGFDTLDGGAGADSLVGGADSDTYVINSTKDKIDESGGGTDDRILASIFIDLSNAAYAGIEHVTLAGVAALSAIGDGGANMLIGNAAANKLDGRGGTDTLIGGAGNDTYIVDGADKIFEYAGGGIDLVLSSAIDTKLSDYVENLTLLTGAFEGRGNALANKIAGNGDSNNLYGGDGNDTLTGNDGNDDLKGEAGADLLIGGKGSDRYNVDNIGDKVVESGPTGDTDLVLSEISYVLGATIEDLQLLGIFNIDGTGNGRDNNINGNEANNVLRGMAGNDRIDGGSFGLDLLLGGDGNDTLSSFGSEATMVGGSGSDTFQIDGGGDDPVDVIADFNGLPGGDVLLIAGVDYDPLTSILDDFVRTTTVNGNTKISVDGDGALNGVNFVEVAVLQGVSTSAQALMDSGSLDLQGAI